MAVKIECGTWTASGSTPQTITLADGAFGTPIAIIAWMTGQAAAPAAGSFAATAILSQGFGTRRGGSTQTGCVSQANDDNVATSNCGRGKADVLLRVLSAGTPTTDYDVTLSSFGNAEFVVAYSSAANASGDLFQYVVLSGLDDAIVLNHLMDSTGATEVVTGVGFLPSVMLALDADALEGGAPGYIVGSMGCASSATKFWSVAVTASDGDTMTSTMRWTRAIRTDALLERLTANTDATNARWDLDSFDADGVTLGVVDPPSTATKICPLLFIKGGVWEAGTFTKSVTAAGGAQTVTLANSALTPVGLILATTNQTAVGIAAGDATMCLGAGSTPNATRGSAVNNCLGITAPENIDTTADRFRATDAIIEQLTGGASPAETSEAWWRSASAGAFEVEWANPNGTTAHLVGYLAVGDSGFTGRPKAFLGQQAVKRAAHW